MGPALSEYPLHRVLELLTLLGGMPMLKCAMPTLSAEAAQQFFALVYNKMPSNGLPCRVKKSQRERKPQ